jgi:hypothetical protein
MNRLGQAFTLINFIPRIIFLAIVGFSIVFLVRSYVVDHLNVQEVQAEVFMHRIMYSPQGIIYFDPELSTAVPGIVDISKVKSNRLDALMNYSDKSFIAGKIEVIDAITGKTVATATYNNQTYFRWLPVAQVKLPGPGGIKQIVRSTYVLYQANNALTQGILKIEVLLPGN